MTYPILDQFPEIKSAVSTADHIDIKTIESDQPLRHFLAGLFSYIPFWMRGLYAIRWGFVRLLGMTQTGMPQSVEVDPKDISFTPGEGASFFEVVTAEEESHYFAAAKERHLTAILGIIVEPLAGNNRRLHVATVVNYHHWTGPVYFNTIRPFHHLVVAAMMKSAVTYQPPTTTPAPVSANT